MGTFGNEHGVVLPVSAGQLTRREIREAGTEWGEWRRSSHGRYVPSYVDLTPVQRVAEAGLLVPAPGAVTGWGSLAWQRARWFGGLRRDGVTPCPVDVATPRRLLRPQPLLHLCEERFDVREVVVVDGLRVTSAVRSVCFCMRYAPNLDAAVEALDMGAYSDLASIEEVAEWASQHPSYTGIDQCRRAVPLGDENAWSPAEVDFRLDWFATTGRMPLTNRPVFDLAGRHIATPDVIDPGTGVAGEYDSTLHLEGTRRAIDLKRETRVREHGLHPVVMVTADRHDREAYHHRLRSAYATAARTPAIERRWTLELPPWWVPTFTVAQRRALTAGQRKRFLAHRTG